MPDPFFIASGTLSPTAACYIQRAADRQLADSLRAGEFCYILDSRQKGKSSLMARAITTLSAEGFLCAKLDIQRFGSNLDPERWYASLLNAIGQDLGLTKELFDYWGEKQKFGPLHRLLGAIEHVILPRLVETDRRLVLFVDEIDFVRSLPFSTDELFAGLRELYNRRADDERFARIAVCLIGVATPSDLIQDVRITPFNVGRRIVLTDFTLEECLAFAPALGPGGEALIRRVHYWTNGHPYLTQRLCEAIVEAKRPNDPTTQRPAFVDLIVESLFLSARAREEEPNLSDVSRRVLGSAPSDRSIEEYRAAVLDLYAKVRERKRSVKDDPSDPLVAALKLAGLTAVVEGYLWVRNRIYFRVFDRQWVTASLPDAELKRQQAAARRATIRTATVVGSVAAAMLGLAVFATLRTIQRDRALQLANLNADESSKHLLERNAALDAAYHNLQTAKTNAVGRDRALAEANRNLIEATLKKKEAQTNLAEATKQKTAAEKNLRDSNRQRIAAQTNAAARDVARRQATASEQTASRSLYVASIRLIQREFENQNFSRVLDLLEQTRASGSRGVEWDYWWRIINLHLVRTLKGQAREVYSAAFSPDGTRVVTAGQDHSARVWDVVSGRTIVQLKGHTAPVTKAIFSPNGRRIITVSTDNTARLWDAASGRELCRSTAMRHRESVAFSPDGTRFLVSSEHGDVRVMDSETGKQIVTFGDSISRASFSPDGLRIVTGDGDWATIWDSSTGRELVVFKGHTDSVNDAAFSPDGKRIVSCDGDDDDVHGDNLARFHSTVRIWDASTGRQLVVLNHIGGQVNHAVFSPDGRQVLTDQVGLHLWDAIDGHHIGAVAGSWVDSPFSPDGRRILTTRNASNTVRVYDAKSCREQIVLRGSGGGDWDAAFSRDGRKIVTSSLDGKTRIWDTVGEDKASFDWPSGTASSISPCGRRFVLVEEDGGGATVRDGATGHSLYKLGGHDGRIVSTAVSPNGSRIIGATGGGLYAWDAANAKMTFAKTSFPGGLTSARVSTDGSRILTLSRNHTAQVWNAATGNLPTTLKGSPGGVEYAWISPDNRRVVTALPTSATWTYGLLAWNATSGELVGRMKGTWQWSPSAHITFSPDSRTVLTTGRQQVLWDCATGKQLFALLGHTESVYDAVFSRDGARIATASGDRTARVWSAATGRELLVLKGHADTVSCVAFSPDGRRIATASRDRTVRIWDSRTGNELLVLTRPEADTLHFSDDGTRLFAAGGGGELTIYFLGTDHFDWDAYEKHQAKREAKKP